MKSSTFFSMIREMCSRTGTLLSLKAGVMKQLKVSATIKLSDKAKEEFARDRAACPLTGTPASQPHESSVVRTWSVGFQSLPSTSRVALLKISGQCLGCAFSCCRKCCCTCVMCATPEWERQGSTVLFTLRDLRLPPTLLDSMMEVHNKVDLASGYHPLGPQAMAVSALLSHGLDTLKAAVEDAVQRSTGTRVITLRVRLAGPQLSWLHREATLQHVDVFPDTGDAHVTAIMSHAAYGSFRKLLLDMVETS